MKLIRRLINRIKCLLGIHDNVRIPGDRVTYDGSYRIVGVTYHVCKRCGKAYSATTEESDDGDLVCS